MNSPKTVKRLTQLEFLKLCDWMRSNQEAVTATETYTAVRDIAVLGTGLTALSVHSIKPAMAAVGLSLKAPERQVTFEHRMAQMEADMIALAKALGAITDDIVVQAIAGRKLL